VTIVETRAITGGVDTHADAHIAAALDPVGGADAGVLVGLAVHAPPDLPACSTPAGPTLAPEALAGHKPLALFDRAAAWDFADVYVLAHRFGKNVLLARAAQIDAGFDPRVLADMIAPSTGSPTTSYPCPMAHPRPGKGHSTQPGDQSRQRRPDQLTVG
jgi:hypothetical protein